MKVYAVMFHTGDHDMVANVFSTEEAAKKYAEDSAASLYPTQKYYWYRGSLICDGWYEEWTVQEWTVQE